MKFMKKAAALIVAASLAVSLTACGTDVSWASKIGKDTTVPIGMYIYTQAAGFRTYAQGGLLSTSSKLADQTIQVSGSDKKASEYLDKESVKTIKAYTGALIMAKEMEIELSEEELKSADTSAKEQYETALAEGEKIRKNLTENTEQVIAFFTEQFEILKQELDQ